VPDSNTIHDCLDTAIAVVLLFTLLEKLITAAIHAGKRLAVALGLYKKTCRSQCFVNSYNAIL
jgi:hypothetical protein